jgi:ankyrin repeat protein
VCLAAPFRLRLAPSTTTENRCPSNIRKQTAASALNHRKPQFHCTVAALLLFFTVNKIVAQRSGTVSSGKSIPIFRSDNDRDTRLLQAAYIGDSDTVRSLIKSGANPNAKQADGLSYGGESVLCLALEVTSAPYTAIEKYKELITYLLDHGADIHPCPIPVHQNGPALVDVLLSHGADPNRGAPLLGAISMWSLSPPQWTGFIRSLLKAGADPNVKDDGGTNVLDRLVFATGPYLPTVRSHPTDGDFMTLVSLLVKDGARVNDTIAYEGDKDCGPRHNVNGVWECPVWNPEPPHCRFPMETCRPERMVHTDTGTTPLMQAAHWPTGLPLVKALLASGADPTLHDASGCSALDSPASPAIRDAIESYLRGRPQQAELLQSVSPCKPAPPPFKLAVSNQTPTAPNTEPTLDKLDFVCFSGRAFRTTMRNQVSPEFGGKKVLRLSIDDPLNLLPPGSVAEITREVLFAVGLWRRTCSKCGIANAAVILIGNTAYVDEQLWHIVQSINDYTQFPKGGQSLLSAGAPGPYTLQAIFANIRTNTSVPLAKYVIVQQSDPAIQRLCGADPDRVPAELQGLHDASDCLGSPSAQPALLQIHVLNGPTHCEGDPKIVVGCEVGGLSVELNARDFTYVKHGTSESIVGKGEIKEDLQVVILHETGHWAGIGVHLTSERNIMSVYIEDCQCIDQAVIDQLAEPIDPSKRTGNVGLLHRTHSNSKAIQRKARPAVKQESIGDSRARPLLTLYQGGVK